ncbi:hypothetical protein [uncultured Psychroserpens sp.]|uniref:hypothetical protein n=1 Tax=uncultured Psychroserpens sp. TaxID=255436 RepID=UPI00260A173E|nr:hypothetical protein [uncultured Psychroserpens sp.]
MDRKKFLTTGLVTTASMAFMPTLVFSKNKITQEKDPLDKELVYQFVAKAHGDFSTVKSMLAKTPSLLNATHDWGGGDFETALGAASHIGHTEIAEYLIANGARFNMFSAAMLGDLGIIQQLLVKYPKLIDAKGPHGLDLIHHANAGGEKSKLVLEYLKNFKTINVEEMPLVKESMPLRKDIVSPSNVYQQRAVAIVDYAHDNTKMTHDEFIDLHFDPDLVNKRGRGFFKGALDRFCKEMPHSSIIMLEGDTHEQVKMIIEKTDKSTKYYFKFSFSSKKPHLFTMIGAGGTRAIFDR